MTGLPEKRSPERRLAAKGGAGRILRGVARCAVGRAEGLALFDASVRGFTSSLAPLIAFPLVGAVIEAATKGVPASAVQLAATLCGVLAPPVISHAAARALGREERWLRYAVAYNWCQWVMPPLIVAAAMLTVILAGALGAASAPPEQVAVGMVAVLIVYWLWLHWFLARHGLDVSRGRAALVVLAVNGCTGAIVTLPQMIA
jgi:hypothetical protein